MARRSRDPDWVLFRRRVWDGLAMSGTVFYLAKDHIAGTCPRCKEPVGVEFLPPTVSPPSARIRCNGGCEPDQIIELMR